MNSQKNLLKRLLNLFPASNIKTYFDKKGNISDVLIELVESKTKEIITAFASDNLNLCKQRVYVLHATGNLNLDTLKRCGYEFVSDITSETKRSILFLAPLEYGVNLFEPYESVELRFLQPVQLEIVGSTVFLKIVTVDKNVSSYFDPERLAAKKSESLTELTIRDEMISHLSLSLGSAVSTIDLNKGIKKLWNDDVIDGMKVRYRKSNSSITETMYGESTFKRKYPDEFDDLMMRPLDTTIFRYIRDNANWPRKFAIDAENGMLLVSQYQDNVNQIENAITEILRENR